MGFRFCSGGHIRGWGEVGQHRIWCSCTSFPNSFLSVPQEGRRWQIPFRSRLHCSRSRRCVTLEAYWSASSRGGMRIATILILVFRDCYNGSSSSSRNNYERLVASHSERKENALPAFCMVNEKTFMANFAGWNKADGRKCCSSDTLPPLGEENLYYIILI